MRLFGRYFSTFEILLFIMAYMAGNIFLLKMQKAWKAQQEEIELKLLENVRDNYLKQKKSVHSHAVHADPDNAEEHSNHRNSEGTVVAHAPREEEEEYQSPDVVTERPNEDEILVTDTPPVTKGTYESEPVDLDHAMKVEEEEQMEQQSGKSEKGYKTILFWNTFFHSDDFRFGTGHQPFLEHKCPVHQCVTTTDKNKLDEASLVMFHGPRITNFPPPRRPKGQVYLYVQQEPHYAISQEELPKYKGYFNLTMTHRRDSDIWIPYSKVMYDPTNLKKVPPVDPKSKPRSLVWVVSHCSTPGKREWYVQELQKYIDIDIYGDCGDMECSKDDTWYCYEKFAKEYRFYMALENNHCKDYVSEKVFRPMSYNIVPVVFGGGNYSALTPPHSVIDILDYPSPKDLAKYLHFLTGNSKAYNRYFAWKHRGYELESSRKTIFGEAFCRICEMLHDPNVKYKDYSDIKSWWTADMCDPYSISRMRKKARW